MTERLLLGKAAIPGVRAMELVCIAHHKAVMAAARVEGWAEPGRRHHLGLRSSSAAKDPGRFITTGEDLLVDAFVAGDHGLG
jgi:hypothetical protein